MRITLAAAAIVLSGIGSGALAQQATVVTRAQPTLATARLASQGIGYSVVYHQPGRPAGPFLIKVVCTVPDLSSTATCPTPSHFSFCPTAQIACR